MAIIVFSNVWLCQQPNYLRFAFWTLVLWAHEVQGVNRCWACSSWSNPMMNYADRCWPRWHYKAVAETGDTVIQTKQKWPQHVIPPDEPVNKMAPVLSRKHTKTKGVPKKCQSGTMVSLNPMSPHYNPWFTKLLQSPVIAQPVFYANQGSSHFGFKSTQAYQASDQPWLSLSIE